MVRAKVYAQVEGDVVMHRALDRACSRAPFETVDDPAVADIVVIDIDDAAQSVLLNRIRSENQFGRILAVTRAQEPERWVGAERSGADRVISVGQLAVAIGDLLQEVAGGGATSHRVVLCSAGDVAGKLGFLVEAEVDGVRVGLFRISGGVHCVQLECPHQGELLSRGEISDAVITCPRHGSQFDLRDGERLRGPADEGLSTYRVVEERGRFYAIP